MSETPAETTDAATETTEAPTETATKPLDPEALRKVNKDLERKLKETYREVDDLKRGLGLDAAAEKIATLEAQMQALSSSEPVDVEALIESKVAEVRAQALEQVTRASIKAAAAGVLNDADDALVRPEFDPQNFVTESGDVDEQKIAQAISSLVESKPYLAAQSQGVKGSGDGGPRNGSQPSQLTRSDLARMTPTEIREAQDKGLLADVLAGK